MSDRTVTILIRDVVALLEAEPMSPEVHDTTARKLQAKADQIVERMILGSYKPPDGVLSWPPRPEPAWSGSIIQMCHVC